MPDHPARQAIANELAKLYLWPMMEHMDPPTIEDGTFRRLAHGLLPVADRIIGIVEQAEKGDD